MNKQWQVYSEKFDALSSRERVIVVVSMVFVAILLWWMLYASALLEQSRDLSAQADALQRETQTMQLTTQSIQQRLDEGVHKAQLAQLELQQQQLQRINELLEEKTVELIDPDQMFTLIRQLLSPDTRLQLTELKRKQVVAVFADSEQQDQPKIFRHVMHMQFEGGYRNIVNYIRSLEGLDWKLMWDRISLRASEYPLIVVEIELSTLSDTRHWVGL